MDCRTGENSLASAVERLQQARLDMLTDDCYLNFSATVYGSGGGNRYNVFIDGTIEYSELHGRDKVAQAEMLGFRIERFPSL